jgi:hypothetical protein
MDAGIIEVEPRAAIAYSKSTHQPVDGRRHQEIAAGGADENDMAKFRSPQPSASPNTVAPRLAVMSSGPENARVLMPVRDSSCSAVRPGTRLAVPRLRVDKNIVGG